MDLFCFSIFASLHQEAVFWVVRRYRIVLYMSLGYLYPCLNSLLSASYLSSASLAFLFLLTPGPAPSDMINPDSQYIHNISCCIFKPPLTDLEGHIGTPQLSLSLWTDRKRHSTQSQLWLVLCIQ